MSWVTVLLFDQVWLTTYCSKCFMVFMQSQWTGIEPIQLRHHCDTRCPMCPCEQLHLLLCNPFVESNFCRWRNPGVNGPLYILHPASDVIYSLAFEDGVDDTGIPDVCEELKERVSIKSCSFYLGFLIFYHLWIENKAHNIRLKQFLIRIRAV